LKRAYTASAESALESRERPKTHTGIET